MIFREQAAIEFYARHGVNDRHPSARGLPMYLPSDATRDAQELADACCASWGHDFGDRRSDVERWAQAHPEARAGSGVFCRRCGK